METLLQKAKKEKSSVFKKDASEEEVELAIGWLKGEISFAQFKRALGISVSGYYGYERASRFVKVAYDRGYIKLANKK